MDVVPGCFPVAKAADVFDGNQRLGIVTEDTADELVFAFYFRSFIGGVVEHEAIHVAEDVVPDPAYHFQIAMREHRGQNAFKQRFARFAVLAGVASSSLDGKLLDRGWRGAERGCEVDEWHAKVECRDRVQRAGG